ncbi:dipeptide/oligopeptide/nickel ABC transporter ATP-binding protein [Thermogymnomonas acidicola]|uniref:ABC transporter ATP-binding protein n=1 Tax=Thermogymnomonas acidicola TaxID=399579 RepID=UPI001396CD86|nr:dipeptide/oligopeptide/nickel ABC transporter ATP-binding protein [Thermogymnomonas acidicola]
MPGEYILDVRDLVVRFRVKGRGGFTEALKGVSLGVRRGDSYGIVGGETGSGKSTLAKTILGINRPTSGSIYLEGREIDYSSSKDVSLARRNIGIVFQDPVGSLNPREPVYRIIRAGLINSDVPKDRYEERIVEISRQVGGIPQGKLWSYPGQLSGGEKQRVSIARALVAPKKILILDEPTSSLDVSIQAEILNLLRDLRRSMSITFIYISHDINVIRFMCNRVSVLYYGKVVECGGRRRPCSRHRPTRTPGCSPGACWAYRGLRYRHQTALQAGM